MSDRSQISRVYTERTMGTYEEGNLFSDKISLKTGETKCTLGRHGAFGHIGIGSTEICLSFPMEWLPENCMVLEELKERGKRMFYELPPNEERAWIKIPYEGPFEEKPIY